MIDSLANPVPIGWQRCSLPEFTQIVMGQSPSSSTYNRSGYGMPFFQGKAEFGDLTPSINLYCSRPKKVAEPGAILLSVRAPVGPTNLVPYECCIGRGLAAIHPLGGIESKFVLYMFRNRAAELSNTGTGSTFSAVSKGVIENLEFLLPPLLEQHRIVAKIEKLLSELDNGVETLKRVRAQLGVYRQTVLKHVFEGKLTADWRERSKEKLESPGQLLAHIRREREAQYGRQLVEWTAAFKAWEKSGKRGNRPAKPKTLREIADVSQDEVEALLNLPKGWSWVRLGNITEVSGGLTKNQARKQLPRKMKYLRVANVYADKVSADDIHEIGVTDQEASAVALKPGDLLIVEGNGSVEQIGRVALWKGELSECGHQNHLIKARFFQGYSPRYFLYFLLSPQGRELIVREANSTTGLHTLSISKVSNLIVPLTSPEEAREVVTEIEKRLAISDKMAETIDKQLSLCDSIRQSILKRAFSGGLVPQDLNDEPASVLLDRIKAEKERLAKSSQPRSLNNRAVAV